MADKSPSLDNLVKYTDMTPEQKKEFHSRGGKAGTASKRRRKTFAETMRAALSREISVEEGKERLEELGYDGTWMDLLSQAQFDKAAKGDTEAFRAIRDTIGEKPRDGLEIGNLDDKPLQTVDLRSLTDDQLRAMIAARQEPEEAE